MSDPTRICPSIRPCPPPEDEAHARPEGTGAADAAKDAAIIRSVNTALRSFVSLDVLGDGAASIHGFERAARFGRNLFDAPQYTDSGAGRVAAAVVETAGGAAAESLLGDAVEHAAGPGVAAGGAVVAAVDGLLDVDDAPKILTAFATAVQPPTVGMGAASLLSDLGTVALAGGRGHAAHLEVLRDDVLSGGYGAAVQGAGLLGEVLAGTEEQAAATSDAAARGDDGVFVAWGNAAGDLWADVLVGASREPRTVPVDEVERRAWLFGP